MRIAVILIACMAAEANGGAALGSEHGSVLFSIRDFWEKICLLVSTFFRK